MFRSRQKRVCVLGAGVIGLSTALRILEGQTQRDGVKVTVLADRLTPHTTSDGSGGFWEPYNVGNTPVDSVKKWSITTWDHLLRLATSELAATVKAQLVSGYMLSSKETFRDWEYKDLVFGYRELTPRELQIFPSFIRSGSFHTTLQITMQAYLPWLMEQFKHAGGHVECRRIDDLSQVVDDYDVVVNCCGLRGGLLVSDPEAIAIRGQISRIHAPWMKHFYLRISEEEVSYILPQSDGVVVVGGVAQRGNTKEDVDEKDSDDIWKRATTLVPALQNGRKVSEWAGLRPGRTAVRLEAETVTVKGKTIQVVHNYGHGGSGVTLHWGCAGQAADLVHHALGLPDSHSKL